MRVVDDALLHREVLAQQRLVALLSIMFFAWVRRLWPSRSLELSLPDGLVDALRIIVGRFNREGLDHAVIGGVAVAMHGYVRATRDLDFLIRSEDAAKAAEIVSALGFSELNRNAVFANYQRSPLRLDFLYTQGAPTQGMLRTAIPVRYRGMESRVVKAEGIIGLKLQALDGNPLRSRDMGDITELLSRHHKTLDMQKVRDYFVLFGKEAELDAILDALGRRGS